ncbi:4'-phosphopantetheinyl transferase family protein [Streptomyces sp. NPDC086023]|uniref:4'-phosphopantetheinyl transferase family protein n=1 Tax=Streptomyces sp. NPDC086023 TaxID=3365746 RepID=UPI0037D0493A
MTVDAAVTVATAVTLDEASTVAEAVPVDEAVGLDESVPAHAGFPALAPGLVHRWGGAFLVVARRSGLPGSVPSPRLSPAERCVAEALPAWRRAEWTAGRLLAKQLVAGYAGAAADAVEVLPRADGSPYALLGGRPLPAVHLSLSHTAHQVAAALAPGPVGVDLCETVAADSVRRIGDHAFSPAELSLIGNGPPEGPAAAWALKEAAVKADRTGVFGAAPRRVALLGLHPPRLGGGRRAAAWHSAGADAAGGDAGGSAARAAAGTAPAPGDAVLALVLAPVR